MIKNDPLFDYNRNKSILRGGEKWPYPPYSFSTSFFYFGFFSKLVFCVSKTSFTPFISAILSPIGLKIFLVGLQLILGGQFFLFGDTPFQ